MRHFALLAATLSPSLMGSMSAQVDGSHTEVSAERRLADYLKQSEIPPDNRPLQADDLPLDQLPRIPGNASATATIIGFSSERMHQGSLEIAFRVQVKAGGSYSFRTQLFARDQCGIEAMVNKKLKPGQHELRFRFFGRALRRCASGKYTLPGILGEKLPDDGGTMGALAYYNKPYTTRSYRREDFSDAVYDSPEKRKKIRELEREVRQEKNRW